MMPRSKFQPVKRNIYNLPQKPINLDAIKVSHMKTARELYGKMKLSQEVRGVAAKYGLLKPGKTGSADPALHIIEIDAAILRKLLPPELYKPAREINAKLLRLKLALDDLEVSVLKKDTYEHILRDGIDLFGRFGLESKKQAIIGLLENSKKFMVIPKGAETKHRIAEILEVIEDMQYVKLYNVIGAKRLLLFEILEELCAKELTAISDTAKPI